MTDQGQSEFTKGKQEALREILGRHMSICEAIYAKRQRWVNPDYLYFDIYAGCGWNEDVDVIGSPLVFMEEVAGRRFNYHAGFIEKDGAAYGKLQQRLAGEPRAHAFWGENAEKLPMLLERWNAKRWTYGMIYADPNGCPPFDLLADVSQDPRCEQIDILIYASATSIKRARGAWGKDNLDAGRSKIAKKHWLIQEPRGQPQWTFLLGTNWDGYSGHAKIKMHTLKSQEGLAIYERLNLTDAEIKALHQRTFDYRSYEEYRQLPEFKVVRAQVYQRAGGVCERCHEGVVTEAHHVKYPPWGTIDVPENMIAVCHKCHCELHGKDN